MSNENGGCGTCGDAKGDGSTLSANNNSAPAERLGRLAARDALADVVVAPYGHEPANIPVGFCSDQVLRGASAGALNRLIESVESNPRVNATANAKPTSGAPIPAPASELRSIVRFGRLAFRYRQVPAPLATLLLPLPSSHYRIATTAVGIQPTLHHSYRPRPSIAYGGKASDGSAPGAEEEWADSEYDSGKRYPFVGSRDGLSKLLRDVPKEGCKWLQSVRVDRFFTMAFDEDNASAAVDTTAFNDNELDAEKDKDTEQARQFRARVAQAGLQSLAELERRFAIAAQIPHDNVLRALRARAESYAQTLCEQPCQLTSTVRHYKFKGSGWTKQPTLKNGDDVRIVQDAATQAWKVYFGWTGEMYYLFEGVVDLKCDESPEVEESF